MDSQQIAVNTLEEAIDNIETLDLSFLFGEAKRDAEYSLNEVIIDLQHIQTIFDAGQN
jgi:hypothetical protein